MDIKTKIDEIVARVKTDKDFAEHFKQDPIKAVESILGVDLPDEQIKTLVEGIKAKVNLGEIGKNVDGFLGSAADKVKGLLHKADK